MTEELAARGIHSVAVDLDGHGLKLRSPAALFGRPFDPAAFATEPSPLRDVTVAGSAETLVGQLRRIGRGRPSIVVAHSGGGAVATAAAELAPELFADLVYLAAFAPVSGVPVGVYLATPENAGERVNGLLAADPAAVGAFRMDLGTAAGRAAARETFYHDVEERLAEAALSYVSPEGPAAMAVETLTVTPERYGSVPHSYIVCTEDRVVPAALQRLFVREIDAVSAKSTRVVELVSSHSPFLSMPGKLVDAIIG
ncbi:peptidase M13 [Virgisporangium aliadipatigenens]|uniref:Peptidase M13 n=1 Tax=Virgisporangium aliadipatigenens TaxID=741659 RepID=A0A8J3YLG1_9ACTN|nr:peptidase M13 [Virgisporangium aliadipatigenens]